MFQTWEVLTNFRRKHDGVEGWILTTILDLCDNGFTRNLEVRYIIRAPIYTERHIRCRNRAPVYTECHIRYNIREPVYAERHIRDNGRPRILILFWLKAFGELIRMSYTGPLVSLIWISGVAWDPPLVLQLLKSLTASLLLAQSPPIQLRA